MCNMHATVAIILFNCAVLGSVLLTYATEAEVEFGRSRRARAAGCVYPAAPAHGNLTSNVRRAGEGQAYPALRLNVTCAPGYGVRGRPDVYCSDGVWSHPLPTCIRLCKLEPHPSVQYHCVVSGAVEGERACAAAEPAGAVVRPECRAPDYYSTELLPFMRCVDGSWDYVPRCSPECGRVTPEGVQLVAGGGAAKRGELPWHTGIYSKAFTPYKHICGGSLVTNNIVISAAHCFYVNGPQPAGDFAVAVGKLYRPYDNKVDDEGDAQKSDISDIKIPVRFQGAHANFQDDIALLYLVRSITYRPSVRPVCLDFDHEFDRRQLAPGTLGKVGGWGLTSQDGGTTTFLKVVQLPTVDIAHCIATAPHSFKEYITSDKVCAGYENNGTSVCQGDSGGGLVFAQADARGAERYYLRGVVSSAPETDAVGDRCNTNTWTTFTQVVKHEHFIKENLYIPERPGSCLLPPAPKHGSFATVEPPAAPGQYLKTLHLNATCDAGYKLVGSAEAFCFAGIWTNDVPKCAPEFKQGAECDWNGVKGRCVDARKCLTTLADTSTDKHRVCNQDEAELIVCCTDCELVNDTRNAVVSPVKGEGILWKNGQIARDKCLEYLKELPYRCHSEGGGAVGAAYDEQRRCHRAALSEARGSNATGGAEPAVHYPYQALLGYETSVGSDEFRWVGYSGTIISDRFILTNGFRATNSPKMVALGVWNRSGSREGWQLRRVSSVVLHPEYRLLKNDDDVALLETDEPIEFSENVLPACLPSGDEADARDALLTTWNGLWDFGDSVREIPVEQYLGGCASSYTTYNHTTHMCYGDKRHPQDPCASDVGDPLVVRSGASSCVFTVIGVKSFNTFCPKPPVFARISYHLPWIQSVVWPQG